MKDPHPAQTLPIAEAALVLNRAGRTFSSATRLLPTEVRPDVRLLYLVARGLDDLVDERCPDASKRLDQVQRWAETGAVTCRETAVFEHLASRHPGLPLDAIVDFCEGQRVDLREAGFSTEAELDRYCYQVAGTVGRLMAAILGARGPSADRAARALGIAMQRTNILRDVDEDLALGRVYIPRETLALAGVRDLARGDRSMVLRVEAAIAEWWYAQAMCGLPLLPRGRFAIQAATMMYREILRQLARDGWGRRRPWRARVSRPRRLWLILCALLPQVQTPAGAPEQLRLNAFSEGGR